MGTRRITQMSDLRALHPVQIVQYRRRASPYHGVLWALVPAQESPDPGGACGIGPGLSEALAPEPLESGKQRLQCGEAALPARAQAVRVAGQGAPVEVEGYRGIRSCSR